MRSILFRIDAWVDISMRSALSLLALSCHSTALAGPLNDTGIVNFAGSASNNLPVEPDEYTGQDASYGRDARALAGILSKKGGGVAGFDFTKLDDSGMQISASATAWACVVDNTTNLVWEVKTRDGGLRDKDNTYSWYNADLAVNGGVVGVENLGVCAGDISCDTAGYVAAINDIGLCGKRDWRLPTLSELRNLVDNGISNDVGDTEFTPTIDAGYFPNARAGCYFTDSTYALATGYAWCANFFAGDMSLQSKDIYGLSFVRLVREAK